MTCPPERSRPRRASRAADESDLLRELFGTTYPLRRPENGIRIHNGEADVLNHFFPERAERLNATATFVLERCDGRHSLIDIWSAVVAHFDVPDEPTALRDVVSIVRYFARCQLVYPSMVKDEQRIDVRHPRHVPAPAPVPY